MLAHNNLGNWGIFDSCQAGSTHRVGSCKNPVWDLVTWSVLTCMPHLKSTSRSKWALWGTGIEFNNVMQSIAFKKESSSAGAHNRSRRLQHVPRRAFTAAALSASWARCDRSPLPNEQSHVLIYTAAQISSIHWVLQLNRSWEHGTAKEKFRPFLQRV